MTVWNQEYKLETAAPFMRAPSVPSTLEDELFGPSEVSDELTDYLTEPPYKGQQDILDVWRSLSSRYPTLSRMARDYLSVPGTTVGVERVFSGSGRLVSPHRSRLAPSTIGKLMQLQNWMKVLPSPLARQDNAH